MITSYSPVSQMKYIIDLVEGEVKLHNDYSQKFFEIAKLKENISLTKMIKTVGKNSQNILYCSATSKAVEYTLDYANSLNVQEENADLLALSHEVKGKSILIIIWQSCSQKELHTISDICLQTYGYKSRTCLKAVP